MNGAPRSRKGSLTLARTACQRAALCVLLFAAAPLALRAGPFTPVTQVPGPPHWPVPTGVTTPWTAAGNDFYLCFPSVVGSDDTVSTKMRSIYIVARAPTRVTVEVLKTAFDTTFIDTPGHYARVDIPIFDALNGNDNELAVSKVVHVYSKDIISVYGYSHNSLSSDGFVVYPTPVLGTSYFAVSTRNALNYKVGRGGDPFSDTTIPNPRSECAVVATEDNTNVTFTLSATSSSGRLLADSTYTVRLNRGQVYEVMARDTGARVTKPLPDPTENWWDAYLPWTGGPDCDLTGSYITADKPIAVFSGHERASVPSALEFNYDGNTRDHLVEEMLPVSAWGTNYIVAASGQDSKHGRRAGGDVLRVLAAFDNTHVLVNGVQAYTLDHAQYAEFLSGNASVIQSNQPVLVADYTQSSDPQTDGVGDPDLTLIRPVADFANEYSQPPGILYTTVSEPYLLLVCDTAAEQATRFNGVPITTATWNPIPMTPFASTVLTGIYAEQRLDSPLPFYAQSYGYGYEDSYTFAGGGDFPYIDSLYAANLDFQYVPVGQTKAMTSLLHSGDSAKDTVQVYNYEWVSGDTANFVLVGGLNQMATVLPGVQVPVPFQFRPTEPRSYAATLRVWSNAVNSVYIKLQGSGLAPKVVVIPDTIDFGRVRLNTKHESTFVVENLGTTTVGLVDLDYWRSLPSPSGLSVDSIQPDNPGANQRTLASGANNTVTDSVHFLPTTLGFQSGRIPISWTTPGLAQQDTPVVILMGTGVEPNVASTGLNFGILRVDSASATNTIDIVNRGSDTTAITSVTVVNPAALPNFSLNLDTLPPLGPRMVRLGYEGNDTSVSFSVRFQPTSVGRDTLIVRIVTVDGNVLFDTITGVGVEPLVLVAPDTIDFGTITVDTGQSLHHDSTIAFTVKNTGTMRALLDSLQYDSLNHYTVLLAQQGPMLAESLDTASTLSGTVTFHVVEEGDFFDTLVVANDTRYSVYDSLKKYQPAIILRARVRTGPIGPDTLRFDTITTCDPKTDTVLIHNPYPVEVHIDSLALLADTGGFSLPTDFIHQISLPPDSTYPLPIIFAFPPDSLNGTQELKLGLYQRRLDGEAYIVDTVTATVIRKQRVFTLHAHLPSFASSANDVFDLKLPITVEGPRAGVTELNSWTLSLKFSNDLFEPVGIDTAGALAVAGDSTYTLSTHWDQATRTYTIIVTGSAVADSAKIANDLLMDILMRAYLTKDTTVAVTPTFTWLHHPCAYNLQSFTLSIPYADECGDPTIRAFMRGDNPFFTLIGAFPNPVDRAGGLSLGYNAAAPGTVRVEVFNEAGEQTGEFQTTAQAGAGTLTLDPKLLPASGAAFIRVSATPLGGGIPMVKMVSVEVAK